MTSSPGQKSRKRGANMVKQHICIGSVEKLKNENHEKHNKLCSTDAQINAAGFSFHGIAYEEIILEN